MVAVSILQLRKKCPGHSRVSIYFQTKDGFLAQKIYTCTGKLQIQNNAKEIADNNYVYFNNWKDGTVPVKKLNCKFCNYIKTICDTNFCQFCVPA